MTIQYEQISSMVDSEVANLTSEEVKDLCHDEESFKVWQRYNLMKGLLKNEVKGNLSNSFMDGFAAKFEKEPIVMAPKSNQHIAKKEETVQNNIDLNLNMKSTSSRWLKYLGQSAIAASVVIAAVVGVNTLSLDNADVDSVINTTPYGGYASPVSAHFDSNNLNLDLYREDLNKVMTHHVSPYNVNSLDPMAENELSEVGSLLNDHEYQVSIYSLNK